MIKTDQVYGSGSSKLKKQLVDPRIRFLFTKKTDPDLDPNLDLNPDLQNCK